MKSLIILIGIFFISACKQETQTVNLGPANINGNSCTIGKWTIGSGLNLKMSSEFQSDFTSGDFINGLNPLEQAAKEWNQAISGNTFFQIPFSNTSVTSYNGLSEFRDHEMGIYKSHQWFNNVSSNALAITQFYGYVRSDNQLGQYIDLIHADIIFNYRDFGSEFSMQPTAFFGYDVPTILVHEMGHFLGLCHDSTHTSIMRPYYITTQRTLFNYDKTKITDLYVNNRISSMNKSGSVISASISTKSNLKEGELVSGTIEYKSNGKCHHIINGKQVYVH